MRHRSGFHQSPTQRDTTCNSSDGAKGEANRPDEGNKKTNPLRLVFSEVTPIGVGVLVGAGVEVAVLVGIPVFVAVSVGVNVLVGIFVAVSVGVGLTGCVAVAVAV